MLPILAHQVLEKHLRFAAPSTAAGSRRTREAHRIGLDGFEGAELQPLPAEILDQARAPWDPSASGVPAPRALRVGAEYSAPASTQEFVVRHAAPQKIGEPRCQLELADRVSGIASGEGFGSRSMRKRKFGETSIACDRHSDRLLPGSAALPVAATKTRKAFDLRGCRRPTVGAAGQVGDDAALAVARVFAANEDPIQTVGRGLRIRRERSGDFDEVDAETDVRNPWRAGGASTAPAKV